MFKKIVMIAVTAIAGMIFTTGCTEESSPTKIVQSANHIKNFKDFESTASHYAADFKLKSAIGTSYSREKLRLISQQVTLLPSSKLEANAAAKAILMDTYDLTQEQLNNHAAAAPEAMDKLGDLLLEIGKGKRQLIEKRAESFKILHEATKGETSTVVAEYKEYSFNEKKEIVERGTYEITYTLKKIDNTWKITEAVETKK